MARIVSIFTVMSLTKIMRHNRHPANAPGDFYVEDEICITCDAPRHAAPDLIAMLNDEHCYFKKQPETLAEVEQAVEAVQVSCCEGLRYAGKDSSILSLLKIKGCASQCDALLKSKH